MKIAVFAGSLPGKKDAYVRDAGLLGRWIAGNGHELIYGAGMEGMMGRVADEALLGGAAVTGIIPQFMKDAGWCRDGLTHLIVTKDMAERKDRMAEMADAFIALPGGLGTLEEIADVISWMRIGFFDKPFVLFNTEGFYDGLFSVIKGFAEERFMDERDADRLLLSCDLTEINEFINKRG